jgi:hypothetical protein
MHEHFIVEWQEADDVKSVSEFVSIRMRGRNAGLYRVKQVMPGGMLLSHGAISFPVGTQLDIDDIQGIVPGTWHSGQVVGNDQSGWRIAWPTVC